MEDIRVDADGNFRCWKCGGRNFSEKRTRRAKVIGLTAGVATFGVPGVVAPLVARKRLYCQGCSEYNKMGNAQPYEPESARPAEAKRVSARDQDTLDRIERQQRQRDQPSSRHTPSVGVSRMEGKFLEVKKPMRRAD